MRSSVALCVALACVLIAGSSVDAVGCQCNNGIAIETSPQCICECLENFQLPDCDYKVNEEVRLDVYLTIPPSEFHSETFLPAVDAGIKLDGNATKFLYAVGLDTWNKTNVLLVMPGYGVKRFIPHVKAREVWVQHANIEAAYVIPIPKGRNNIASVLPTYVYRDATITAEGWSWLGSAMFLVTFMICLECCRLKNVEDVVMTYPDNTPRPAQLSSKRPTEFHCAGPNEQKPSRKESIIVEDL